MIHPTIVNIRPAADQTDHLLTHVHNLARIPLSDPEISKIADINRQHGEAAQELLLLQQLVLGHAERRLLVHARVRQHELRDEILARAVAVALEGLDLLPGEGLASAVVDDLAVGAHDHGARLVVDQAVLDAVGRGYYVLDGGRAAAAAVLLGLGLFCDHVGVELRGGDHAQAREVVGGGIFVLKFVGEVVGSVDEEIAGYATVSAKCECPVANIKSVGPC